MTISQRFLGNLGVEVDPPPKMCAGLIDITTPEVTIGSKKDREEAEELEKLEAAKKKFKGMTSVAVDDPQYAAAVLIRAHSV